MRNISSALQKHYKAVKEQFPETTVLGVFLYGSQNYNIATENSDVDTVAIVIPTFKELVLNSPVSKEIHFENGEHCVVKDIREVVKQWKKQSLNYLEILFTDYYFVDPLWKKDWNCFVEIREDIASINKNLTIKSIAGQAKHTFIQNRFDKKKQANALRMYYFLKAFLYYNKSYKECLTTSCEKVLAVKTGKEPFPFSSGIEFFNELEDIVNKTYGSFPINEETEKTLDMYLTMFVWRTIIY